MDDWSALLKMNSYTRISLLPSFNCNISVYSGRILEYLVYSIALLLVRHVNTYGKLKVGVVAACGWDVLPTVLIVEETIGDGGIEGDRD